MTSVIPIDLGTDDIIVSSRKTSKTKAKSKGGKVHKMQNSITKYTKPRVHESMNAKSLHNERNRYCELKLILRPKKMTIAF